MTYAYGLLVLYFMSCTQLSISLWELLKLDRSGVPVLQMDPDPAFHFDADPDPTIYSDVDLDPDPTCQFDAVPDPDPTTHFFPDLGPPISKPTPLRLLPFLFDVDPVSAIYYQNIRQFLCSKIV
jgi:hypothetical protein